MFSPRKKEKNYLVKDVHTATLITEFVLQFFCMAIILAIFLDYKNSFNEPHLQVVAVFGISSMSICLMSIGRQTGKNYLYLPYFICIALNLFVVVIIALYGFAICLVIIFAPSNVGIDSRSEWCRTLFHAFFGGLISSIIGVFLFYFGLIVVNRSRKAVMNEKDGVIILT